jgi:hypothetical protein
MNIDDAKIEAQRTRRDKEKRNGNAYSNGNRRIGQDSQCDEHQQIGVARTDRARIDTFVAKRTAIGGILFQLLGEAKGQLERYEDLIKTLHIESSKTQKYVESLEALLEQLQQSAE